MQGTAALLTLRAKNTSLRVVDSKTAKDFVIPEGNNTLIRNGEGGSSSETAGGGAFNGRSIGRVTSKVSTSVHLDLSRSDGDSAIFWGE